jgi:hypothetical protein
MSMVAVAIGSSVVGAASIIGTIIAVSAQAEAAKTAATAIETAATTEATASTNAAQIQADAAQAAIDQQAEQFAAMQEILKPWVDQGTQAMSGLDQYQQAGSDALTRQRALMGLDGPDAQRAAMEQISSSPEMMGMIQQGENALLQQGAATGGLRGGNTQGALAQFRPQVLSSLINQQYGKLGGLIDMGQGITMNRAALGQASASGLAAGNLQQASSMGNLLMQQGGALAGGILGAGQATAQGQYQAGMANANQQLASGQAWAQVPNYFVQGGLIGYGLKKPGAI